MKIQGINFEQYSYLSFLGMYPSYGKSTVWSAKSQPDTHKLCQNHNLIYPSDGNTIACRYPLSSVRLTDSPSWVSMIPKLEKLRESEAWSPSLVAQKFTYLKRTHILVKFLVYSVKFDKPLLVVTLFYFLFFNYTSVYFLKKMFTNVS